MKKLTKKTGLYTAFVFAALLMVSAGVAGCGKKGQIQVFTYEENADGSLSITGLTEKGSRDSSLKVPAQIEGKKVSEIAREAFRDNTYVTELMISDGVTRIAENAFLNCTNLSEITFPADLAQTGTNIVKNTEWEKKQLEEHSEIIIGSIFIEAGDVGSSYEVPDGVKYIASGAFYYNETVKEVVLPDSLETIGSYAFAGCKNLTSLKIPDKVSSIGYDAFLNVEQVWYNGNAEGSPWGAGTVN